MSKVFAWILFVSSVGCFLVQLTTQQLAARADEMRAELVQPISTTQPWQFANLSDHSEDF